jgi:hypothetical protein
MDTSNNGAGRAFSRKLRTVLSRMGHYRPSGVIRAEPQGRPTVENVKSIISVSLDLLRTALACIVALRGWGLAAA